MAMDRGCHDMAVVLVGQGNSGNQVLVPANQAIQDACVHKFSCALEPFGIQIPAIGQQVPDPFIVYRIGPLRLKKICRREFDQQVSQGCWIQDAGVIEDDKARQDQ